MTRRKPKLQNRQTASHTWTVALVAVAIVAGLTLGLSLNRPLAATGAQEQAEPVTPGPSQIEGTAPSVVEGPLITPEATIPLNYRPDASPEAQLQLTLEIAVTDAATKQPLPAQIWVAGTLAAQAKARQNVTLNLSNTEPKIIRIRIEAEGHETWVRDVRFKVLYSRRVPLPVELEPLHQPGKGSGGIARKIKPPSYHIYLPLSAFFTQSHPHTT